jgi:serine/threonine protein phosphatase PrpC
MAMRPEEKNSWIGTTDFLFSFCREKKPENGEDSFVFSLNESRTLLGVFDGCGGSGASQYAPLKNKTGAYLAARAASAAYRDWFDRLEPGKEAYPQDVKSRIVEYLKLCEARGGAEGGSKLMGRMAKKLPTTAAVALCQPGRGGLADVQLQWAGDSRVYLLDGEGLAQLTEDDLGGIDAMRNLSEDGVLTNVINLTRDFTIHSARITLGRPGLLFAATDGCFGYLSTPMEFEYLLLRTLQSAASASDWEKTLAEEIGKVAGDDYTLCGAALGFGSFDSLKRQLAGRTGEVYRNYIRGLESCTKEEKQQLWEHYRDHYHRYLCRV